jgi:2,3-bisphosphoglycerate-dependent phosphoglycerate mutase
MTASAVPALRPALVRSRAPVLWLVRHGETTWNERGLIQGHRDEAVLTDRGVRQAWKVARQLGDQPIRTLYVSDLRRALQTAAPLASVRRLPAIPDARLRERCLGTLEGGALAGIGAADTGLREGQVADPDARPAGGESLRELYQRVAAFTGAVTRSLRAGDVAVIAHGGTLRVLCAHLGSVPVERMRWDPVANGRILRLAVRPGQVTNPRGDNR